MRNSLAACLVVPALLLMGACSTSSGPSGGGDQSFSADVQPIFDTHCLDCHGANGGLDLSPALSYANLVSVVSVGYSPQIRVQPGDPENSVLYGKVAGNSFGGRMPLDLVPLTDDEIETIRLWIQEGALSN